MQETYYYGQGKVYSRPYGSNGPWRWWGDLSKLTFGGKSEMVKHKESFSGSKALTRSFPIGKEMSLKGTLHQLDSNALAQQLWGAKSAIAGGAVTGETFPTGLVVGDIVKLDHGGITSVSGVSTLIVTDSAGSPAPLTRGTHYSADDRFGSVEILALGSFTQPFKGAYTHAGGTQVNFMTQAQPILEFRYEGINLAEQGAPVIVEFYKAATDTMEELALITDGTDVAGTSFSADVLLDGSKPVDSALGQFGRHIQVTVS
jgi:hypothetical protein